MSDTTYWLVFFAASLALNLSPGPDLIYVLSRTIAQGTKIGLASAAGVCTGAFVFVLAAAFGLSAVLAVSTTAFSIVKFLGSAYLLYLGIRALRSRGASLDLSSTDGVRVLTPWQAYGHGILVDLLNPKVAIFFMAFLPQFVRPDHGNTSLQLVGLGSLVILLAIIVEAIFVLAVARTTEYFRNHPTTSAWLDRSLGAVLVGLAVRLALTEQSV